MKSAWSKLRKVNFLRPWTVNLKIHFSKFKMAAWGSKIHQIFFSSQKCGKVTQKMYWCRSNVTYKCLRGCLLWIRTWICKFNTADLRWRMEFSKIAVESLQNVHTRVFGVADYEFIVRFTKFNMADKIFKNKGKISTKCHSRVFGVADYEFIVRFTKFNMADLRWRMKFWKIIIKSVRNLSYCHLYCSERAWHFTWKKI